MPKTRCPNCDSVISMNKPREGAVIICPHCGVELEVIRADPFAVDFTDDWQEDWEEE
jgi:lysine biosynthesis protein LysW